MAEGWAKHLDVRARARADAHAGLPPLDARTLSPAEADVLAAHARERARLESERETARLDAERAMRRAKPETPDFAGALAAARLALAQIETRAGPDSAAAVAREARAREDLEAFRRAQHLRRDAVYPQSTLFQGGLLLVAALFEAVFSATLFAQEAEQGLLGGAAVAIGLSAANVTLGFLAGFLGLRYVQPRRLAPRLMGGTAFAVFFALAVGLNLFAARWRESLEAAEAAPADPFAPRLDLFGFAEPQAVVLLMLGAGVWVFAALKGYSGFDDPYPDYGKMHRAHRSAADALAVLREDVVDALEGPVEDAKAAMDEQLAAMRGSEKAMRKVYEEAAAAIEEINVRLRRLDDNAQELIALYRRENVAARGGQGPAYFGEPSPHAAAPSDALEGAGALLQATRTAIATSQREAADALAALQEQTQAIAARFAGA